MRMGLCLSLGAYDKGRSEKDCYLMRMGLCLKLRSYDKGRSVKDC